MRVSAERLQVGRRLVVNEIFGPTIQGEGPSAGAPAIFLRLGGCNLRCAWCDTKYTWDWSQYDATKELIPMTIQEALAAVDTIRSRMKAPVTLVITGGEPLLQAKALAPFLIRFWDRVGHDAVVEIETAGTLVPGPVYDLVTRFNVSPKLAHSGNPEHKRIVPDVLHRFAKLSRDFNAAVFKFVVQQPSDFIELDQLVSDYRLSPVYVMPEAVDSLTAHTRSNALVPMIIERGYRLSPRLHIDIFGNRRGV